MKRRPLVVRQHDPTDCGAAVLASVAGYWGLHLPLALLRQYTMTDREGTTVLGIVRAAEQLGFYAKGARILPTMLPDVPLPAIAHMYVAERRWYHFVVLYRVKSDSVLLGDPARGLVQMPMEEFLAHWTGIVIILAPREDFQEAEVGTSRWRLFWRLLRPHQAWFLQAFLGALLFTLLGMAPAIYVGLLFDTVIPTGNTALLHALSAALVGIVLVRAFLGWMRSVLLFHVVQRIDAGLVLGYFRHLLRLPQAFFDARRTGEILSRVTDAVKVRNAISTATLTLLVDATMLATAFALMWLYSPQLALVTTGTLPLYAGVIALVRRPMQQTQRALMEQGAELHAHFTATITGMATVKALTAEVYSQWKAERTFVGILRLLGRSLRQYLTATTAAELLSGLATAVVFWWGSLLVLQAQLSVGQLLAVSLLLGFVLQPLGRLLSLQQLLHDAFIAADRLFEIMVLETETPTAHRGIVLVPAEVRGEIEFRRCTFRYGARPPVLRECSLRIPAGSITAIVGESGSGKTTLVRLLLKLYPIQEGAVLLDGIDIRDIDTESLRRIIGVVPQEVELFHGTVLENIAYGDMQPDRERALAVCRRLGLDRMIAELPGRYETLLGEHGVTLSGGQRQRLAIARALYRQPRVLVLDEATSNLDAEAEAALLQLLRELRHEGITIVLIAHRLSTVQIADKIAVLADGHFIEEGTHRELLARQGLYARLWQRYTAGAVSELALS
ncbi:Lactococcin-G-processing and transport ATP-binding protein LagD [bacterium HR21]|nr:Lactococcin-G-processing and transport ATP-binding protein LagD [bacterium HR21]